MDNLEELDPLDRVRLGLDSASVQSTDLPDKIKDWLGALNSTNNFIITPQKTREEDGCLESYPPVEGRIIEMHELGRMYGPGKYRFSVEYRPTNWTAEKRGRKTAEPSEWFILSEEGYADLHKEYKEGKRSKRLSKLEEEREEKIAKHGIDPLAGVETLLSRFIPIIAPIATALINKALAPAPVAPSGDSALLGVMMNIMNENSKRAEERSERQQEFQFKVQQENTRLMLSLNNRNESSDKIMDKMFGMVDNMLTLKTRVEKFNGEQSAYIPNNEESESGGIDWGAVLTTLGTALIPHLGMLAKMPLAMQQSIVNANMQDNPQAIEMMDRMKETEENRLFTINAFVKKWGIESAKQVLDIGGFKYTNEELLRAETLARIPETPAIEGAT